MRRQGFPKDSHDIIVTPFGTVDIEIDDGNPKIECYQKDFHADDAPAAGLFDQIGSQTDTGQCDDELVYPSGRIV